MHALAQMATARHHERADRRATQLQRIAIDDQLSHRCLKNNSKTMRQPCCKNTSRVSTHTAFVGRGPVEGERFLQPVWEDHTNLQVVHT